METLRRRLREFDIELVSQLNARAELAKQLVDFETGREDRSQPLNLTELDRLAQASHGPLDGRCVRAVFRELVSGCREIARPTRVAYLGPQFSYSHLAAVECFGQSSELLPVASIAEPVTVPLRWISTDISVVVARNLLGIPVIQEGVRLL